MKQWKTALAVLIGLAGAVLLWVIAVVDNRVGLSNASASYVPALPIFLLFGAGLLSAPALRRFSWWPKLDRQQFGLIAAMLLASTVLTGQGLFRSLPSFLTTTCEQAAEKDKVAAIHEKLDLPSSLLPEAPTVEAGAAVSRPFLDRLEQGEAIPWRAWAAPALAWGAFFVVAWAFMLGLAMMVYPQWRDNERLQFPLASVYEGASQAYLDGRIFWLGFGPVLAIYILNGLNQYLPNQVPQFPLSWNLRLAFTGNFLSRIPGWIVSGRIYFAFAAVAFLAPRRVSFSIWFFVVAQGLHEAFSVTFLPSYDWRAPREYRMGAILAAAVAILWYGRAHWRRVAVAMFRRLQDPEDRLNRLAGWLFLAGTAGLVGWLVWVGVPLRWALVLVLSGGIVCLVTARIVAAIGMPFLRLYGLEWTAVFSFVPGAWLTAVTVYAGELMNLFFLAGSRMSLSVMATHALAVDDADRAAGRRRKLLAVMAVLAVGFFVCGGLTLRQGYRHDRTIDGHRMVESFGAQAARRATETVSRFEHRPESFGRERGMIRGSRLLQGAAMAGALEAACLWIPRWPLHPIGLVTLRTFYANVAWPSMFLGWLLQVMLVRYGGSRAFNRARVVCMGVIVGEASAIMLWRLVAFVRAFLGATYHDVSLLPS
jgi:hypothetical protein